MQAELLGICKSPFNMCVLIQHPMSPINTSRFQLPFSSSWHASPSTCIIPGVCHWCSLAQCSRVFGASKPHTHICLAGGGECGCGQTAAGQHAPPAPRMALRAERLVGHGDGETV